MGVNGGISRGVLWGGGGGYGMSEEGEGGQCWMMIYIH